MSPGGFIRVKDQKKHMGTENQSLSLSFFLCLFVSLPLYLSLSLTIAVFVPPSSSIPVSLPLIVSLPTSSFTYVSRR